MWSNEGSTVLVFPPANFHNIQDGINMGESNNDKRIQFSRQFRGTKRKTDYNGKKSYNNKMVASMGPQGQFHCDTCDRSFEGQDLLDDHFTQHKTCGWNGCTFQAHYKIVELHVKMQHETGFADKIMILNNPEEIEKWKNERRKNYPSAENVARRQSEQAKMLARGELIPNKSFGKFIQNNRGNHAYRNPLGRGRVRGRGRPFRHTVPSNGASTRFERRAKWGPDSDKRINYFDLDVRNRHTRFEDAATGEDSVPVGTRIDEALKEGLVSNNITDSEDESAEAPLEMPISHVPKALSTLLEEYQSEPEQDSSPKGRSENVPNRPVRAPPPDHRPPRKSTLLEMLLAKEIRQERNMIFQCVRYIVQNDFFDENKS